MRVPAFVQDCALRLPSGRPQVHVLSVSGVVHKRRAPDPTGQAESDAGETIGRVGEAEEAARARKVGAEQGVRGGNRDR